MFSVKFIHLQKKNLVEIWNVLYMYMYMYMCIYVLF